jgi:hypothetical protein
MTLRELTIPRKETLLDSDVDETEP